MRVVLPTPIAIELQSVRVLRNSPSALIEVPLEHFVQSLVQIEVQYLHRESCPNNRKDLYTPLVLVLSVNKLEFPIKMIINEPIVRKADLSQTLAHTESPCSHGFRAVNAAFHTRGSVAVIAERQSAYVNQMSFSAHERRYYRSVDGDVSALETTAVVSVKCRRPCHLSWRPSVEWGQKRKKEYRRVIHLFVMPFIHSILHTRPPLWLARIF